MSTQLSQNPTDVTHDSQDAHPEETLSVDQLKTKSITGAASYFARTVFIQVIGLISIGLLGVYLSAEEIGIYGFVINIIGILVFFSDIGLAAVLIQAKKEPTLTDYQTAFTIQQGLSWLIMTICVGLVVTGVVSRITGPAGNWVLLALGLSFPLATLKTISSVKLERQLDFAQLALPQVVEQVVFHGLLIGLVLTGWGVLAYPPAILARSVVGAVTMWALKPWRIGLAFNLDSLKRLGSFGLKFQANDLLARVKDNLFYSLLAGFLPLSQFGFVSWAKTWSIYPYNLTVQNVMAITFPAFSRLQDRPELLAKAIEKSLFFITLVLFPLITGMAVFIYPLTQVIPGYEKWQPAILTFVLFTLSIGWSAISTPLTNVLNAIGKINWTLGLMIMWTVLTWTLTPLFMWWFGFNGVALAAFVIALTSFMPVALVKRLVTFNFWDQVWRQLVLSILMAVVGLSLLPLQSVTIDWLLVVMAATGLCYPVAWLVLGRKKLFTELSRLHPRVKKILSL